MTTPPDETAEDSPLRLDEARTHAEEGRLDRAAELFREVLQAGDTSERAQAALGLAVVLEGDGDHDGAREADRIAIETKDPEYGARAAYHLALSWERSGERDRAREAWHTVVDFAKGEQAARDRDVDRTAEIGSVPSAQQNGLAPLEPCRIRPADSQRRDVVQRGFNGHERVGEVSLASGGSMT